MATVTNVRWIGLGQQAKHAITAVEKVSKNQIENDVKDQRQTKYGKHEIYQEIKGGPSGEATAG
jgi:hypothetical protein